MLKLLQLLLCKRRKTRQVRDSKPEPFYGIEQLLTYFDWARLRILYYLLAM